MANNQSSFPVVEREVKQNPRSSQRDIAPTVVKPRHITGYVITPGLAADRPTNGDTEIKCWWATDTNTLSIWNGTAWKEEIFT